MRRRQGRVRQGLIGLVLLILMAMLVAAASTQAAEVYYCQQPQPAFSDRPCGARANRVKLAPAPMIGTDMAIEQQRLHQLNKELKQAHRHHRRSRLSRLIDDRQQRIASLKRARAKALAELSQHAGGSRAQRRRLKKEKAFVRQHYQQQLDELTRELRQLRAARRSER